MPLSFMRETVTIQRGEIATKNGMEYIDYNGASTHEIENVLITAQSTSREFGERTLQVDDRRTLRAPYGSDIKPGDHVVVGDTVYEIDGDVFHTKSPTGRVSSTRCTLVRWEG